MKYHGRRTLSTSAGEQTVVATVPCKKDQPLFHPKRGLRAHSSEAGGKVTHDVVLEILRLKELSFEEVIPVMKKHVNRLREDGDPRHTMQADWHS